MGTHLVSTIPLLHSSNPGFEESGKRRADLVTNVQRQRRKIANACTYGLTKRARANMSIPRSQPGRVIGFAHESGP